MTTQPHLDEEGRYQAMAAMGFEVPAGPLAAPAAPAALTAPPRPAALRAPAGRGRGVFLRMGQFEITT